MVNNLFKYPKNMRISSLLTLPGKFLSTTFPNTLHCLLNGVLGFLDQEGYREPGSFEMVYFIHNNSQP